MLVLLTEVFGNVISIEICSTVWKLQPTNSEYISLFMTIIKQPKIVKKVTLDDVTSYSLIIYSIQQCIN